VYVNLIAEVVKVDAKGRITIPAYVRLLLNVDEGSKVLMHVDEERGVITLRSFQEKWVRCRGTLDRNELAALISRFKIVSLRCVNEAPGADDIYRCDLILESPSDIIEQSKNIYCFKD